MIVFSEYRINRGRNEITYQGNNELQRFNSALIRFFCNYNLLETNIGLCISHLWEPADPSTTYSRLANMTMEQMMMKLKDLFMSEINQEGVDSVNNFNDWYEKASNARYIRNRYVHGHWEFLRGEKPIKVSAPPWMKERMGEDASEYMTIDELEAIAEQMKSIFEAFMLIRKKHGI
ncbi:MAG TPA: hypothetical protein VJ954_02290 [Ignavibacteriaceae bacterium]|nr:hypothetical protein [Ignavibacteriaceae bacterium]